VYPYYVFLPTMIWPLNALWQLTRFVLPPRTARPGYEQRQSIGWNRIPWQLRHRNEALVEVDHQWRERTDDLRRKVLAYPDERKVFGRKDGVIAEEEATSVTTRTPSERVRVILAGTHQLVKDTTSAHDDLVTRLFEPIEGLLSNPDDVRVALWTAHRTVEFSCRATLIGEPGEAGSQRQVFDRLREFVSRTSSGPPIAVVVGDTGTGKSMVLRTLSRIFCNDLLTGTPGQGSAVIHLPLEVFRKIPDGIAADADALWDELRGRWEQYAGEISRVSLAPGWTASRLQQGSCLLILDSTDEFLLNNPNVSQRVFVNMVDSLRKRYSANGGLRIVLGARKTHSVHTLLKKLAEESLELAHLSRAQIERHFPQTYKFLAADGKGLDDSTVEILSPLVLDAVEEYLRTREANERGSLAAWEGDLELAERLGPLGLLEVALYATLRKAKLQGAQAGTLPAASIADWYYALVLLAMVYAQDFASELPLSQIKSGIAEVAARLRTPLQESARQVVSATVADALRLLDNPECLDRLLSCSLFFPTRRAVAGAEDLSFRFKHREWHDFLLGRYFALVYQVPALGELAELAFLQRAQQTGGEILLKLKNTDTTGFAVDEAFTGPLIAAMQAPGGHFVLGNLGGLLGNSPIQITRDALHELLRHRDRMPAGGKLVFFAGLGHRILRKFDGDGSWAMLKAETDTIFRPALDVPPEPGSATSLGTERVLASISWCYLQVFAGEWNQQELAPAGPWNGLCATPLERRQLVDRLHAAFETGSTTAFEPLKDVYRNCQFAFAAVQPQVLRLRQSRPISLVHYLYTLAAAYEAGVLIEEARSLVLSVLASGSDYATAIDQYGLPEVRKVFEECRRLFSPPAEAVRQATAGAPAPTPP
jgi:hypothetical protein